MEPGNLEGWLRKVLEEHYGPAEKLADVCEPALRFEAEATRAIRGATQVAPGLYVGNESTSIFHPHPSWRPQRPHPDCVCGKPLLLYVPPGETAYPCHVHPERGITGGGAIFCG